MKQIIEWIVAIAVSLVLIIILKMFVVQTYTVNGESMFPTFNDQEKVVVQKIMYDEDAIHRGDVIVFKHDKEHSYIKRVIAKAGDKMRYDSDILYINDKPVEEPYLEFQKTHKINNNPYLTENISSVKEMTGSNGETVPEGKIVVMGDNRENSIDSRDSRVGLVDTDVISGKVVLRYWPFDAFKADFDTH